MTVVYTGDFEIRLACDVDEHFPKALVADSTPNECVVLFNTQLFALDEPAEALRGSSDVGVPEGQ